MRIVVAMGASPDMHIMVCVFIYVNTYYDERNGLAFALDSDRYPAIIQIQTMPTKAMHRKLRAKRVPAKRLSREARMDSLSGPKLLRKIDDSIARLDKLFR